MSKEAISLLEASKQALEALEWLTAAEPWDEPNVNKTITSLRQAIAEAAVAEQHKKQEPVAWVCRHKEDMKHGKTTLLCTTDKELADAWLKDYKKGYAWLSKVFD